MGRLSMGLVLIAMMGLWGCKSDTKDQQDMQKPSVPLGSVQGMVYSAMTGAPLKGINVTVYGGVASDGAAIVVKRTSDDNGVFQAGGLPAGSQIMVVLSGSADSVKYRTEYRNLVINNVAGNFPQGGAVATIRIALNPLIGVVRGVVYGMGQPLANAQVWLRNASLNPNEIDGVAMTDAMGAFSFNEVAAGDVQFNVDVAGKGGFRPETRAIGSFRNPLIDWNHLVVVTREVSPVIVSSNVAPDRDGNGQLTNTERNDARNQLANPSDSIVVHFGSPVLKEAGTVQVRLIDPDGVAVLVGDESTLDQGGFTMTLTPGSALAASADPNRRWTLRIDGLRFLDGTVLANILDPGAFITFKFNVYSAPPAPANPEPKFYFDNVQVGEQVVAGFAADSDKIYLKDANGDFLGGFGNASGYWTGSEAQLYWNHSPGAVKYRVYARNADNPTSPIANLDTSWKLLKDNINNFYPNLQPLVHVSGINLFSQFGLTANIPYEYGNRVEVAVASVNHLGVETPISATTSRLLLFDDSPASISSVTTYNSTTERGSGDIIRQARVTFAEKMSAGHTPTLALSSGMITNFFIEKAMWSSDGTPVNTGTTAYIDIRYDIRGACTEVVDDAESGSRQLMVRSAARIQVGATEGLFFPGISLSITGVDSVDLARGMVTLTGALSQAVATGQMVCVKNLQSGDGTTLTSAWTTGRTLYVNNAEAFYIGQPIVMWESGTKKHFTTITGLNTKSVVHEIHVNNTSTINFAQGNTVITYYSTSEYSPRTNTTGYALLSDVSPGSNVVFEISRPLSGFTYFMVGDQVLLDDDGDINTTHDQGKATITSMQLTTSAPYVLTVDSVNREYHGSSAKVFLLADSFKIQGVQDTSGNGGLNPRRDEFHFNSSGLVY